MTNDVAADLERLICDLADISSLNGEQAARKAARLYNEMRLKYPVSVMDSVEPPADLPEVGKPCICPRCQTQHIRVQQLNWSGDA